MFRTVKNVRAGKHQWVHVTRESDEGNHDNSQQFSLPTSAGEWVALLLGALIAVYVLFKLVIWLCGLLLAALPFLIIAMVLGGIAFAFNADKKS